MKGLGVEVILHFNRTINLFIQIISICCVSLRPCLPVRTHIRGEVIVRNTNDPVVGAKIWFDGSLVDLTNDEGRFNFTIDEHLSRIVITVAIGADSNLIGTTQVLVVQPGTGGTVFTTIILLQKASSLTFQSIAGAEVTVGSGARELLLDIPANALYTENGDLYEV